MTISAFMVKQAFLDFLESERETSQFLRFRGVRDVGLVETRIIEHIWNEVESGRFDWTGEGD